MWERGRSKFTCAIHQQTASCPHAARSTTNDAQTCPQSSSPCTARQKGSFDRRTALPHTGWGTVRLRPYSSILWGNRSGMLSTIQVGNSSHCRSFLRHAKPTNAHTTTPASTNAHMKAGAPYTSVGLLCAKPLPRGHHRNLFTSPAQLGLVSPRASPYLPTGHNPVQLGDASRVEVP